MDYFPQELMPTVKKGAVIVDAGISSSIFELEKYTELIGEKGKIFAFEASPIECEKAKNIIATKPLLKNALSRAMEQARKITNGSRKRRFFCFISY